MAAAYNPHDERERRYLHEIEGRVKGFDPDYWGWLIGCMWARIAGGVVASIKLAHKHTDSHIGTRFEVRFRKGNRIGVPVTFRCIFLTKAAFIGDVGTLLLELRRTVWGQCGSSVGWGATLNPIEDYILIVNLADGWCYSAKAEDITRLTNDDDWMCHVTRHAVGSRTNQVVGPCDRFLGSKDAEGITKSRCLYVEPGFLIAALESRLRLFNLHDDFELHRDAYLPADSRFRMRPIEES
jgi:hypothetical protein